MSGSFETQVTFEAFIVRASGVPTDLSPAVAVFATGRWAHLAEDRAVIVAFDTEDNRHLNLLISMDDFGEVLKGINHIAGRLAQPIPAKSMTMSIPVDKTAVSASLTTPHLLFGMKSEGQEYSFRLSKAAAATFRDQIDVALRSA